MQNGIDAVFFNTDYTPFSKKRDNQIKELCDKLSIQLESTEDLLLHHIDMIKEKRRTLQSFYSISKQSKRIPCKKNTIIQIF